VETASFGMSEAGEEEDEGERSGKRRRLTWFGVGIGP
jgi:hypothetical protein